MDCLKGFHTFNMKAFVAVLFAAGSVLSAPAADPLLLAKPYINQGSASGPLTPAVGDLVATPKGYKSIALEGFSEDLNQDGFVDPTGQAVAPVAVKAAEVKTVAAPAVATYAFAAPAVHTVAAPAVTYAAAPVAVKAAEVKTVAAPAVHAVAAPVATYAVATAPVVQHVGYQVHHQVQHIPQVSVQKHVTHHTTQHVINH